LENLCDEFDKLFVDIRTLPGFENFLLPPSECELRTLATAGPNCCIQCVRNSK
jgi:hypothetical protein